MIPRAVWKGFLKVGSVACGVKLITAASEAGKVHFKILNRKDELPVKSAYLDEETGEIVSSEDQVKGYELETGEYVVIEPEEIKQLKPTSEHTLDVDGFISMGDVDPLYLEKPYYIVPADPAAVESYSVIRDAMAEKGVAAMACIVLYQRGREVVIRPLGNGLTMTELRNHNEVVKPDSVFGGLKAKKLDEEMIEIATLLIEKKKTAFDPSRFEDTYEEALIEMINAKLSGKKPPKPVAPPKENVINLAEVLRKSLQQEGLSAPAASAPRRRKSA